MAVPIKIKDYGDTTATDEINQAIIEIGHVPLDERLRPGGTLVELLRPKYPIETVLPPPMNRKERRAEKKRTKR